jgi:hypothetical protein
MARAARGGRVVQHFVARRVGLEYVGGAGGRLVPRALPSPGHGVASAPTAAGGVLRLTASATAYLLPKGFPESVGPDYLPYSAWMGASTALGSAAGVLSMQALLCAAGIGGPGAAPLAASLNWVIKDGLGQLAAVLSAALISDRFDADPKYWRATAAACEVGARVLESVSPLFPGHFLFLASTANLGKSVACLAASATRASFHQSLERRHNLADITGKAGSQAIASSLAGTALGLGLSTVLLSSASDAIPAVGLLSLAQLGTTHAALRSLALPTLTRAAADELIAACLDRRSLPSPAVFSAAAPPWLPGWGWAGGAAGSKGRGASAWGGRSPRVLLGSCSLDEMCASRGELAALREAMGSAGHLVAVTGGQGGREGAGESGGGSGGTGGGGGGGTGLVYDPAGAVSGPFRVRGAWAGSILGRVARVLGRRPPAGEVRVLLLEGAGVEEIMLALMHATMMQRAVADGQRAGKGHAAAAGLSSGAGRAAQASMAGGGGACGVGVGGHGGGSSGAALSAATEAPLALVSSTLQRARAELPVFLAAVRAAGWDLGTAGYVEDEVSRLKFWDEAEGGGAVAGEARVVPIQ